MPPQPPAASKTCQEQVHIAMRALGLPWAREGGDRIQGLTSYTALAELKLAMLVLKLRMPPLLLVQPRPPPLPRCWLSVHIHKWWGLVQARGHLQVSSSIALLHNIKTVSHLSPQLAYSARQAIPLDLAIPVI